MSEHVRIEPITLERMSTDRKREIGRRIQTLVMLNFLRVGVDPAEVVSFADPTDDAKIAGQIRRIAHASSLGMSYGGVYEENTGDELQGVVKIGPWTAYDAEPFGEDEVNRVRASDRDPDLDHLSRPQGLHTFSVKPELINPTLNALYGDDRFLSLVASLNAPVHEDDERLHDALTELGASKDGPTAIIKIGSSAVSYTIRRLPPKYKP